MPQIVSGTSKEAEDEAAELFGSIAPEIIRLSPREAELVKLFNNAFRYIQFAVANQFFLIAESAGVDYYRVMDGMKRNYSRGAIPAPASPPDPASSRTRCSWLPSTATSSASAMPPCL